MTTYTPRLGLPFIEAAQAQKHVTHNAALERLDTIVQLQVQQFGATTPPASPQEGQSWALGTDPTGIWAGQNARIATFSGGGWIYFIPRPGWRAWGVAENILRVWTATGWANVGLGLNDIDTLPKLGLNATADTTNRLTVAAPATLFNHAGGGHQVKVNKANAGATASLLYQTGFSGRAELGLAGNDDLSIKVSANGSTWTEALRIDAATGAVSLPQTRTRQLMAYTYRHYLFSDRRWTAPSANASSTNANANLGTGAVPDFDWNCKGIFVPAGSLIRAFTVAGAINGSETENTEVGIYFHTGPWNGGWINASATTRTTLDVRANSGFTSSGGMVRYRVALNFTTPADGYVFLATRPSAASNITTTQYFECAGMLDVACPLAPA